MMNCSLLRKKERNTVMSNKISITAVIISLVSLCCSAVCLVFALNAGNTGAAAAGTDGKCKQYVMYVGTNDKDTYKPEYTQEEARDIVDRVCLRYFGGYTLQEAGGVWTDEKQNITHEYTLVCYFDDADKETVYKAADELIKKLNQNTILIEEGEITIDYYSGK